MLGQAAIAEVAICEEADSTQRFIVGSVVSFDAPQRELCFDAPPRSTSYDAPSSLRR
jgi:hypothetical protein